MIGGMSRAAVVEEVVDVEAVERGCDTVVGEDDRVDAVTGEDGVTSG